ncbi:MAG: Abortive infection protein AbiEi [Bacillota bacterium]|nr:Abortive infection protein AbiEi [Bacillota bacterium]
MNDKIKKRIRGIFIKNNGYARSKELVQNGINPYYINNLENEGYIIRVSWGLYKWNEDDFQYTNEIYEIYRIIPKGVICLTSALAFHELTTYNPWHYQVAIERNKKVAIPEYPPIKLVFFTQSFYELGITEVKKEGHKIRVYDLEKTICDCIRYRNKIGPELVKEGMNEYMKRKDRNLSKLIMYAQKCKVERKVKEYLEVLI